MAPPSRHGSVSNALLVLAMLIGALAVVSAGRGPTKGPKGGGMPTGGSLPMPKPPMCGKMKNHQYKCPTCQPNASKCIDAQCTKKYDGTALVTVNAKSCFGDRLTYVAVQYDDCDTNKTVCADNKHNGYNDKFTFKAPCGSKLTFYLQDNMWHSPMGPVLGDGNPCSSKCGGEPCTTCSYDQIEVKCPHNGCMKKSPPPPPPPSPPPPSPPPPSPPPPPACPMKHKKPCPSCDSNHCFKFTYDPKHPGAAKVVVKGKKCFGKKVDHIAASYQDCDKGPMCADARNCDDSGKFYFYAKCGTDATIYLEDDSFYGKTMSPIPMSDPCFPRCDPGKPCDTCGPYPIHIQCKW